MVNFGNWIRLRIVLAFLTAGLVLAGIAALLPSPLLQLVPGIAAGILLVMCAYLGYVYYQFSERGGRVQRRLWMLVLAHLPGELHGRALDIGTGNGPLAILLAQKYPDLQVTGIDYWGKAWEYSQQVCVQNAAALGVADRTHFEKASAADLPFADGTFDAAVSHFVFHEVADAPDKRAVIRQALRVVRQGGAFAFQDMFLDRALYGDPEALLAEIRSWGVAEVHCVKTCTLPDLPPLLHHPRVLGHAALLYGIK